MAEVSVRPAHPDDAAEIARIQVATWQVAYQRWLPPSLLAAVDAEQARQRWHSAVAQPPTPRHHVLVALEQQWRVGFAAFGPPETDEADPAPVVDPQRTAQLYALHVEPRWGRRGHGSRLLAATVAALREEAVVTALIWVPEPDAATATFLTASGWERDGYGRTLHTGDGEITELRWHTDLTGETG